MHLKRKASLVLFALAAIFASTSLFASIPRSEILTSSNLDLRYELASPPPAPDDNSRLLARALDRAMPRQASLQRYAETRVREFEFAKPLFPQGESGLTRGLRRAYERLSNDGASGDEYRDSSNLYAFAGGDPVNGRDPTGTDTKTKEYEITERMSVPLKGESRAQFVRRLQASGYSFDDAVVIGACQFAPHSAECYSPGITQLAQRVDAQVKAEGKAILKAEAVGVAAVLTGGLAGGAVATYGGGTLLATTVGGATGGVVGSAVNAKLNGQRITAPNLAQGGLVGIAGAYVFTGVTAGLSPGPINRINIPESDALFPGLTDAELDAAFANAQSGPMVRFSDANGPLGGGQLPTQNLWFQEIVTVPGVGPNGEAVAIRTHSPNPTAPPGSFSSQNYTTQFNTVNPVRRNSLYLLPDGTWKRIPQMTPAERAAAHYGAGQ